MNEVFDKLTVGELKSLLERYDDDTMVYVKTWASDLKKEIEVIEGKNYIVLKGIM